MMSAVARGIVPSLQPADACTSTFTDLVASEQRRVFYLCRNMLQDRDEADDATQDVFLRAFAAWERQASQLDDPAKWITRIAVNVCLDRLRSKRWRFWARRSKPEVEEVAIGAATDRAPSPEARLFAVQIRDRVAKALPKLSDRQRAAFVLRHYEDRSIEQIAELMNLEQGSVKSHLFRALEKMRTELKDLYESGQPPLDR